MIRLRQFAAVLVLLTLTSLIWAAQAPGPVPTESQPRTVTDMRGRSVEVPDDIEGIIALNAGSLRLLSYFDSLDKVIAVEDSGHGREKSIHSFFYLATYRIAHPRLQELPSIGDSRSHEQLIAADPGIIFSTSVDIAELDLLQDILDIPVFALDADVELNDPQRFFEQIHLLGSVLQEPERAQQLVSGISELLDDLQGRAGKVEEPRRAYAGGMMFYGPADLLRTSGDYIPFDLTGTVNVMPSNPAGNLQPYMTSIESLIAAGPEYVFVDAANSDLARRGFEEHRDVLFEHVDAFRNNNIHTTLVYKYYGTNWENQLINIYYAGSVMYPELYSDIDIQRQAEEIWELFFQVPMQYSDVMQHQGRGLEAAHWVQGHGGP